MAGDDESQVRESPAVDVARPTPQADNAPQPQPQKALAPAPSPEPTSLSLASASTSADDRSALLDRARVFLTSPQIRHEEPAAKRRFLAEKGLNDVEIEGLLRELPPQLPPVPPRTYPQSPPSNLPYLLIGLTKIFTWLTGGSALLVLIYYRFLLPRLTRSALARRSLKTHQAALLSKLRTSLTALKETQAETFAVLPPPRTEFEPVDYEDTHSLSELKLENDASIGDVPPYTVLRCSLEELAGQGTTPTKEELFAFLEEKIPWLKSEEGSGYETFLWETLTTSPHFTKSISSDRTSYTYTPPHPPPPTPLLSSLQILRTSFPVTSTTRPNAFQGTLDALTDFTGYITTQMYRLPGVATFGLNTASTLGPKEEEVRREIRALKGLVLNRRTFAGVGQAVARAGSAQTPIQTP